MEKAKKRQGNKLATMRRGEKKYQYKICFVKKIENINTKFIENRNP